jgi:hypothetical protein
LSGWVGGGTVGESAALTTTLAATYLGSVLLLQVLLNGLVGDSGLADGEPPPAISHELPSATASVPGVICRSAFGFAHTPSIFGWRPESVTGRGKRGRSDRASRAR